MVIPGASEVPAATRFATFSVLFPLPPVISSGDGAACADIGTKLPDILNIIVMVSNTARILRGSLCFCLFMLIPPYFYLLSFLHHMLHSDGGWVFLSYFFRQMRSLVAVLFGEITLVAGAAFADGIACAEWAAAVLVAGA